VRLHEDLMGHMVVDAWSHQYQRWVYMDVLFDFHYESADGTPLDLLEVRDRFWRRGGRDLYASALREYQGGAPGRYPLAETARGDTARALRERTLNTFWALFYHGQNYFSRPVADRQVRILRFDDDLTRGKRIVGGGYEHYADEPMVMRTTQRADVYPTMGNAEIQLYLTPQDGPDGLRVYVATHTPNLKRIRFRLNGGAWRSCGVDGFVVPRPGRPARIEAFAENLFGIRGRASRVTVRAS
jgi:hypothetical protein